jgi:MFS family permease
LLARTPRYPTEIQFSEPAERHSPAEHSGLRGYIALFRGKNLRATILASVPWFLQDLGTYGIGIFTPTILAAAVGQKNVHVSNVADLIHNDMIAAKGAALIDLLLLAGIAAAIVLADRVGRIFLMTIGFIGCALGLAIAAMSTAYEGSTKTLLIFVGFMLFNFMTNLGPNAQTYLIAGEVFPTAIRGKGAGFAASFAKIGACLTAFLFPILLVDLGAATLLNILIGTSLLGALVTWVFRIETAGVKLDTVGTASAPREELADIAPPLVPADTPLAPAASHSAPAQIA